MSHALELTGCMHYHRYDRYDRYDLTHLAISSDWMYAL